MCQIKYNQDNQVVSVLADNGNTSLFYQSLASNPLLDDAVEVYKNVFSNKIKTNPHPAKTDVNGEPIVYYRTPSGNVYKDYRSALDDTTSGTIQGIVLTSDDISYSASVPSDINLSDGIKVNDGAFTEIFTIDSNSNPDTLKGFINQQIRLRHVSDQLKNGRLQGFNGSKIASKYAKREAVLTFGSRNVRLYDDGTLDIKYVPKDSVEYKGRIVKKQAILDMVKNKEDVNPETIALAYSIYRETTPLYKDVKKEIPPQPNYNEQNFQGYLKTFLNRLGVKVTSIDDYVERYAEKNSTPPSAEALADIANRVVAFAQGQITTDALSEETAHFAIEAMKDQETVGRMLRNVHNTQEWKQFSNQYLQVYGQKYKGAELDNIVRREILGKILSNKLKERFAEKTDPTEQGFTEMLRDLWNNFIQAIRNSLTPNHLKQLNDFTEAIADNILNEQFDEIFDQGQLNKSDFVMYSLNDKRISVRLQEYYNKLQRVNSSLKKTNRGNLDTPLNKTREILEKEAALDNAGYWTVILQLNAALSTPLNRLTRTVEDAVKKYQSGDPNSNKLYLDGETIADISNLSDVREALQNVVTLLENNDIKEVANVTPKKSTIIQEIRSKVAQIDYLKGQENYLNTTGTEFFIDKFVATMNLGEAEQALLREQIQAAVTQETKDVTFLSKLFGQGRLVNNVFINIASKIFSDNSWLGKKNTQEDIDPIVKAIADNGYKLEDFREMVRVDDKGSPTGYLLSEIDVVQFNKDLDAERERILRGILNLDASVKQKEVLEKYKTITGAQREQYKLQLDEWLYENTEQRLTKEAYDARRAQTVFMAQETRDLMAGWSRTRGEILRKYRNDFTNISQADLDSLAVLTRERKLAKSLMDDTGELKTGIDLRIAEDLLRNDKEFAERNKDKVTKIKTQFAEKLKELESSTQDQKESNKAAWKFVMSNGGVRFNNEFYEALGTKTEETDKEREPKVVTRLRDLADELEDGDANQAEALADVIKESLNKRSDILRKYQKPGNPSEVDTGAMSETAKQTVRELDEKIQNSFREANAILKKNGITEITPSQVETENTVNESYYTDFYSQGFAQSDLGTQTELVFVVDNVSLSDKSEVIKFRDKVDALLGGTTRNIEPKYKRFFSNHFGIDINMDEDLFVDQVLESLRGVNEFETDVKTQIAFAKTKMYSYYKRFAPKGYEAFMRAVENGDISPSEMLDDPQSVANNFQAARYVEITPSYMWNEDDNTDVNPNFDPDWKGGPYQPKKSKYLSKQFQDRFGTITNGVASRNNDKYQFLQMLYAANEKIYNNYGKEPNIYKQPQISEQRAGKLAEIRRVGARETGRRILNDIFQNRVDTLDYGLDQNGQKVIPVKYIYDLEEASDVTLNLGLAFTEALYESNMYVVRNQSFNEVSLLLQNVEQQKFTNSKTGKESNSYKMLESFIDYNIFGKTQSERFTISVLGKEIDLSRLALVMHRFVQWGALTYNPIIALTNYSTGVVNKSLIEAQLGQFLNRDSVLFAEKEFDIKEAPLLTKEVGKINRTSKLYKVLEQGGVIDFRNRLEGAQFGKVGVVLNNMGYGLLQLGDTIVKGKVFIATLDDMRGVNGNFVTYNQFRIRPENTGLSRKQIAEKWDALRDQSLWSLLQNEEGSSAPLKFSDEATQTYGAQKLQDALRNTLQRAATTSANVDGQITEEEKSMASRNFLLRFTTGMRSWLFNNIQNRVQGRKVLLQQGQIVEGSYITAGNYLNNVLREVIKDKNIMRLVSAVKSEWNNLDDVGKMNLKRTLLDFAVFVTVAGLAALALSYDDEDDSWLEEIAAYLLIRTENEIYSQTMPGLVSSVTDIVSEPIVAMKFVKEVMKGGFSEDIGSGPYEGVNKLTALAIKQTPIKQAYTMFDAESVDRQMESYRYFNQNALFFLSKEDEE